MPRPSVRVSTRALLLLCVTASLCARLVEGSASQVFGFCQSPHAGEFSGGWSVALSTDRCHRGMFGVPGADGSLFDSKAVPCLIPGADPTSGDSSSCTCLGVPQVCMCFVCVPCMLEAYGASAVLTSSCSLWLLPMSSVTGAKNARLTAAVR